MDGHQNTTHKLRGDWCSGGGCRDQKVEGTEWTIVCELGATVLVTWEPQI